MKNLDNLNSDQIVFVNLREAVPLNEIRVGKPNTSECGTAND